jgi:hypothetical protein
MANQSSIEYAAGKVRCLQASFDLSKATQGSSDVLTLGQIPANARIKSIKMTSSVSLGSSTVAIGISGTAAKYRAAGVFTTVDIPTIVGPGAVAKAAAANSVAETLIATVATAALPSSGTLIFEIEFVTRD